MFANDLNALLQTFPPQDREQILGHITVYDDLLAQLPRVDQQPQRNLSGKLASSR